jgi:hypothetical protein
MRLRTLVMLIVVGLVALLAWRFLGGSAESRIRQRLAELAETASRREGESDVVTLATARAFSDFFTSDCRGADGRTGTVVKGRGEVVRALLWARDVRGDVSYEVDRLEVRVEDDDAAEARFDVRVLGADEHGLDGTAVTLEWRRETGVWRVASAFVERPGGD